MTPVLLKAFDHYKQAGKMSISLRRGLLTLIPKKNKDPTEIKNLRPLMMLNNDYKILARIIAVRLESVVDNLIGSQQTGFVKGRCIEENIMTTMEIIAHANRTQKEYIIMTVDFSKCFDRVSHHAIRKVLNFFNFGENLIKYIMLLYTDFELCTQNNGVTSKFLHKERGINQGCNASPLIYIFVW